MRFGIFDHVERRNDVGQAQQYEERLQFTATADAIGFHGYHVAEHHHSLMPKPPSKERLSLMERTLMHWLSACIFMTLCVRARQRPWPMPSKSKHWLRRPLAKPVTCERTQPQVLHEPIAIGLSSLVASAPPDE